MASLLDRFNKMQAGDADGSLEQLEAAAEQLAGVGLGAVAGPVHIEAVGVLERLMSMGNELSDPSETPMQLRMLMRTLTGLKPLLTEMLAKVPQETIVQFMVVLRDDIQHIIDTGSAPAVLPVVDTDTAPLPSVPVDAPGVDVPLPLDDDTDRAGEQGTA